MEVLPPDQTYELQAKQLAKLIQQLVDLVAYRSSERPYVSRCRPFQPEQSLGTSKDSSSDGMPGSTRINVKSDVPCIPYDKR